MYNSRFTDCHRPDHRCVVAKKRLGTTFREVLTASAAWQSRLALLSPARNKGVTTRDPLIASTSRNEPLRLNSRQTVTLSGATTTTLTCPDALVGGALYRGSVHWR